MHSALWQAAVLIQHKAWATCGIWERSYWCIPNLQSWSTDGFMRHGNGPTDTLLSLWKKKIYLLLEVLQLIAPPSLEYIWWLCLQMENLIIVYFNYQLHASHTDRISKSWQRRKWIFLIHGQCQECNFLKKWNKMKSGREKPHPFFFKEKRKRNRLDSCHVAFLK